MPLALEVAGVLLGMWFLAAMLRQGTPSYANSRVALVAVPAVIATAMAASTWWPAVTGLVKQANHDSALTKTQGADAGATLEGANAGFFSWVSQQIPPHDTYYLVSKRSVIFWASFSLLPRYESSPHDAQWLVYYGVPSSSVGAARSLFGPERLFAPHYGIARRR